MSGRIELHRVDLGRRQTRLGGCLAGRELGPVVLRRAGDVVSPTGLGQPDIRDIKLSGELVHRRAPHTVVQVAAGDLHGNRYPL